MHDLAASFHIEISSPSSDHRQEQFLPVLPLSFSFFYASSPPNGRTASRRHAFAGLWLRRQLRCLRTGHSSRNIPAVVRQPFIQTLPWGRSAPVRLQRQCHIPAALFLATILLATNTISGVHSLDILIMLHIFFGSVFTVFFDARIGDRIEYFSSLVGIVFKTGIVTAMAAVGVWFWFYNIQPPVEASCKSFAFLFGRVGLYSAHTMISFKAFSATNIIICLSFLLSLFSYRTFVWFYSIVLDKLSPWGKDSPTPGRRILAMLVQKTAMDKKKLLTDIWILSTEAIAQSTVPARRNYIGECVELAVGYDRTHGPDLGDWQGVKEILLRTATAGRPISGALSVLIRAGDILNGGSQHDTHPTQALPQV